MKKNIRKGSDISIRLYASAFLLLFTAIFLTGLIAIKVCLDIKSQDQDTAIREYAEVVANMPEVTEMILSGKSDADLAEMLDSVVERVSMVDIIVICNSESTRLYHTSHDRIGHDFFGGDEDEILGGADPYISVAVGTLGPQRRAFCGIDDENGNRIGFVMASVLQDNILSVRKTIIGTFIVIFCILMAAGGIAAGFYQNRLQQLFLGFPPEEFANLYIERDEVMDALEEGLFAIDTKGRVILMNQAARRFLELPETEQPEGHLLTDYYPETRLPITVKTGIAEHNVNFRIKGRHIISSRIPVRRNGKIIGAVSIFRNKTEVTRLAEELIGTKYMIDTLRAVNHEFTNKLHVILGLLEMKEYDKAREYIMGTSLISGQAVNDVSKRIPIPSLAALFIGKFMQASELGIQLILKQDTFFNAKQDDLPVDCYITLVGNLLQNAIDELNSGDYPDKRIELGIYVEDKHTTIICDDTGGGIPEEILSSIYDRNTTTKGEGHGNGFSLMKDIVDRYEGTLHIDTEPGEGTSIEIDLPV